MDSLQGQLLIASHKLLDPNFHQTVVLVVQHGDQGALGLVLNRPLELMLDDVWSQVSELPCLHDAKLFQGGPCEGTLMVLHGDNTVSSENIIPGVCFSPEKDEVEQLVAGNSGDSDEDPIKFFVGYAGWGPGQLEGELESGAWFVTPAQPEQVFSDGENLWDILRRRVTLRTTCPWLKEKLIPDDPTVN